MRLLLITTTQNAVRKMLSEQSDIDLCVIDCVNYLEGDFQKEKQSLLCSIERHFTLYGSPDVLLTYRCPFLISPHLYEKARIGAFNIHPSLLPKYKGLNPWTEIFRNHESEGGVTLHKLSKVIDNGIVVSQKKFIIEDSDTIASARNKADELAAELANDFISNLKANVRLFSLPNKYDYLEAVIFRENLLFLKKNDILEYDGIYKEGAFCVVFQMCINGEKYAIRCWKCLSENNKQKLCRRMKLVSNWINDHLPIYMHKFYLFENGIKTKKGIQPVSVMKWHDDSNLKEYLSMNFNQPQILKKISDSFVAMVSFFHNLHVAHGDMNMDNIRVSTNGTLYIIDYDTFYIPTMGKEIDDQKGESGFQHHARKSNMYLSEYIDYYSEYVIYITIRTFMKYPEIRKLFVSTDVEPYVLNKEELANVKGSRIYLFVKKKEDTELMSILHIMDDMWHNNKLDAIIPIEKSGVLHIKS